MKSVAKYNLCKGISTLLTIGTPTVALFISGAEIVSTEGKMSITACIVCLLTLLFAKDKIAENLKVPSAFILSAVLLGLIIVIENILLPLKGILIATCITSGVDELTFKRIYKQVEQLLPDKTGAFKHAGFIFTTTDNLEALKDG